MYKLSSRVRSQFKPPRLLNSESTASYQNPLKKPRIASNLTDNEVDQPQSTPKSHKSSQATQTSSQNTGTVSSQSSQSGKKYICQWRKFTNRKTKTWDGDGILIVKDDSITAKIDGKTIKKKMPKVEGVLRVGSYELEIDCEMDDNSLLPVADEPMVSHMSIPKFKTHMPNLKPVKQKTVYPKTEDSIIMKKQNVDDYEVMVDPKLGKLLRPHQVEGVRFLYEGVMGYNFEGNGVLLADDMGLGKTLMSITLIWTLLKQSPDINERSVVNRVLIVCPVTLINNWKREFKKWLNLNQIGILVIDNNTVNYKQDLKGFMKSSTYQVLVISYEKVLNCEDELIDINFDLIICDEGHKLKNNSNKCLKILTTLDVPKKVLLSGTPIQNNLNEFYTLINFINPGILGTFNDFQKNFIKPIERSRDVNCFNREIIKIGKTATKELSQITKRFILRRTNEVLFKYLDSKTDILLFAKPTQQQQKLFDLVLSKISFSDYDNKSILNLINTFRKICNSPSLLADDGLFNSISDSSTDLPISSGKIDLIIMLLIEIVNNKKEKLVIVSNYTKTLDLLESVLKKLNLESLRLDGSTNSSARTLAINQFNTIAYPKFPVFLLSSKSGGFGINLIGASRLILFDNDWNPANDLQAMSRIYRDGQTKPVFIYRLFTTGSLDEKILQRQLMKNNLSDKFLNDSKVNSNIFDMEDLKDLFTVNDITNCNTHDLLDCDCDGLGQTQEVIEPDVSYDSEDDDHHKAARSSSLLEGGYMSALNYSQMDQTEAKQKQSIQNALSDYKHHDTKNASFNCSDDVTNTIVKRTKDENTVTFVFTKVSNKNTDTTDLVDLQSQEIFVDETVDDNE